MDKTGRVKDLRCYTCNIEGFPACDDPFMLEHGRLANCTEDRADGRVELCAKIIGTVVEPKSGVMNVTSEATASGRNFSLANYSYQLNDYYFGRTCFPLGDEWVWRNEPYNETFILGDLTISASVYICRNTRCNEGHGRISMSRQRNFETITMTILLAGASGMLISFIRDIIL